MKKFNRKGIAITSAVTFTLSVVGIVLAVSTINLGTADNFAILAGTGMTNTGASTISGDVGSSPTHSETGFTPCPAADCISLTGVNHNAADPNDATTQGAKNDLTTAYGLAVSSTPFTTVPTELGGTTKFAGAYNSLSGTFGITGTVTLDGQGDPNAVFIFQTTSTLITAGASKVTLINGAQACNVFWQVGSSATLGGASFFKGNILALTSVSLGNSANVEGRILAQNGAVTLDTNTITRAVCVVPPIPTNTDAGGVYSQPWIAPIINVLKVPSPLALPLGPGPVVYDYAVSNIGVVAMDSVTVNDNKCAPAVYLSGDTNSDSKLDLNEIWKYSCTTNLSQTTTNTVTATGHAFFFTAIDTANATVVVGSSTTPPLIHIVKKPNVFNLPAGGGPVTYTYTVTNPGTVPLSDVSVIDDKCTGLPGRVVGHPGDLNKNDLLDSNEIWTFTCQTNITKTTTNTGTAEGHANGLTAIDFSLATVVVGQVLGASTSTVGYPALPNTGFAPNEKSIPWGILALVGILGIVSASIVAFKKVAV